MKTYCLTFAFLFTFLGGVSQGYYRHMNEGGGHRLNGTQTACQPLSINTYNWNNIDISWNESLLTAVAYNDSGWKAEETAQTYFNGNYTNSFRNTFTYNLNGDLTEQVYEIWTGSAWENDERWTYAYDGRDSLIASITFTWTGGVWDTTEAQTQAYTYNGSNQLIQYESSLWDNVNRTFDPETRERYTYNGSGEIDTIFVDVWVANSWFTANRAVDIVWFDFPHLLPSYFVTQIQSNGSFEDNLRTNNIYSGAFNNKDAFIETYNNGWDSLRKTITRYDAHGNLMLNEGYTWNSTLQEHEFSFGLQIISSYDMNGCRTEMIEQLPGSLWYENSIRRVFNNFGVSALEAQNAFSHFSTYPNPASQSFTLALEMDTPGEVHYRILDLQGAVLQEKDFRHLGDYREEHVELQVPAGMYILEVSTKNQQVVQRIVVQ